MDWEPGKNYRVELKSDEARGIFLRTRVLSDRVRMCEIQVERFLEAKEANNIELQYFDMHFLLVSITNLLRMLKSLKTLLKYDKTFALLYKKHLGELERIDRIRDHAEHIEDGRLEGTARKMGRKLNDPSTLGKIDHFLYDFGGEVFDVRNFQKDLSAFMSDYKRWEERWYRMNILNISLKQQD